MEEYSFINSWICLLCLTSSPICLGSISKVYHSLPPTTTCVRTNPFLTKEQASVFVYSIRTKRAVDCSERSQEPAYCDREHSCECHKVSCTTEAVRETRCLNHPCAEGQECYLYTPCPAHYAERCTELAVCTTNMCLNWGTCWNYTSAVNQYKCDCYQGFYGGHCESEPTTTTSDFCENLLSTLNQQQTVVWELGDGKRNSLKDFRFALSRANAAKMEIEENISELPEQPTNIAEPGSCHEGKNHGGDIVFVVDSSGSNDNSVQLQQRQYMKDFLANFIIGPEDFQLSILTFSFDASVHCYLNTHADNMSIIDEIDKLPYVGGPSYLGKALKLVYEEVLLQANGMRPSREQHVIVLSDGLTSDPVQTNVYANLLKQTGVQIYSVMFGPAIYHPQLKTIVSKSSGIFSSSTLDAAHAIAAQHSPYCVDCVWNTSDVVILFDATMATLPFNLAIDALLKFVEGLFIDVDYVPISYIRYADDVSEEFDFTTYTSKTEVLSQISLRREKYNTPANHIGALEHVTKTGFDSSRGARSEARKLVVWFTQGHFEIEDAVMAAAEGLKSPGVWLATVGVGKDANADMLIGLASEPSVGFAVGSDLYIMDDITESLNSLVHYYVC